MLKRPKMKTVIIYWSSSRSKPVWMCLFWTQRKIFWRKFVIRLFWDTIDFHSRRKILLCFPHSSEYLPLCSEQTHSYRFGSTWGWVNDRIIIFGCTVPLSYVLRAVYCLFLGRLWRQSQYISSMSETQGGGRTITERGRFTRELLLFHFYF